MSGFFSTSARSGCASSFWPGAPSCGESVAQDSQIISPESAAFRQASIPLALRPSQR